MPYAISADLIYYPRAIAFFLGLLFGSFLNVVLTRLPEDESVVFPGSHCRHCNHILAWWENLPLLSWIILRGRCRSCRTWISIRYPLVELTVALLWTACWTHFAGTAASIRSELWNSLTQTIGYAVLCWLLVALGTLDAAEFWLPDVLTLPGAALGLVFLAILTWLGPGRIAHKTILADVWSRLVEALAAAAVILIIRLLYWLVRRREGMGLGDAKLMALLGAWLGLEGAMESFAIAVLTATAAALAWLAVLAVRRKANNWAKMPLPLGTFLCIGALSQIFFPGWLFLLWSNIFLG